MMQSVKGALEDADVALLIVDVNDNWEDCDAIFSALKLRVPAVLVLNKIDRAGQERIQGAKDFF
ncbi:GTP-binding protein [Niabella ginsengisoli]|nr:GTP-binding protein [Niabella ginsengisoli]MCH5599488.1 GTP-binding protein [Niabella ginsengisoli]